MQALTFVNVLEKECRLTQRTIDVITRKTSSISDHLCNEMNSALTTSPRTRRITRGFRTSRYSMSCCESINAGFSFHGDQGQSRHIDQQAIDAYTAKFSFRWRCILSSTAEEANAEYNRLTRQITKQKRTSKLFLFSLIHSLGFLSSLDIYPWVECRRVALIGVRACVSFPLLGHFILFKMLWTAREKHNVHKVPSLSPLTILAQPTPWMWVRQTQCPRWRISALEFQEPTPSSSCPQCSK